MTCGSGYWSAGACGAYGGAYAGAYGLGLGYGGYGYGLGLGYGGYGYGGYGGYGLGLGGCGLGCGLGYGGYGYGGFGLNYPYYACSLPAFNQCYPAWGANCGIFPGYGNCYFPYLQGAYFPWYNNYCNNVSTPKRCKVSC